MFSNPRMKTIPKNHGSWVVSRSCSTLKVTHQSSDAAETQYNWVCVGEIYSHFLVQDLKHKCVRQWLCVLPMVSMSHKDTLLEKCSLMVASWLGKTPIMRGSLVGRIPTCLVASTVFFPPFLHSFVILKIWWIFSKNRKINWIYTRKKIIHWLPPVSKNPQNNNNDIYIYNQFLGIV
jgi:hypothetical protein